MGFLTARYTQVHIALKELKIIVSVWRPTLQFSIILPPLPSLFFYLFLLPVFFVRFCSSRCCFKRQNWQNVFAGVGANIWNLLFNLLGKLFYNAESLRYLALIFSNFSVFINIQISIPTTSPPPTRIAPFLPCPKINAIETVE